MFSLNSAQFTDRNICHYSKRAWTCHLLHKRPGCYHNISKTPVRKRIFKWSPVHASVICSIPWIRWIHWISIQFRENSVVCNNTFDISNYIYDDFILWDRWHFEWHFKWHFILHFITRHDISYNNLWCYMHNMTFHGKPFPNISYQVVCFCAMNINIYNFI